MPDKVCRGCGFPKALTEFYKHEKMADGHLNYCKTCKRGDANSVRSRRIEYYRKYDRERGRTEHRLKKAAKYQAAHPEQVAKAKAGWIERNPEKRAAHIKVGNAIRNGRITKQPCEKCGEELAEAHHDDYSNPLDVNWLCTKCHNREHSIDG